MADDQFQEKESDVWEEISDERRDSVPGHTF